MKMKVTSKAKRRQIRSCAAMVKYLSCCDDLGVDWKLLDKVVLELLEFENKEIINEFLLKEKDANTL